MANVPPTSHSIPSGNLKTRSSGTAARSLIPPLNAAAPMKAIFGQIFVSPLMQALQVPSVRVGMMATLSPTWSHQFSTRHGRNLSEPSNHSHNPHPPQQQRPQTHGRKVRVALRLSMGVLIAAMASTPLRSRNAGRSRRCRRILVRWRHGRQSILEVGRVRLGDRGSRVESLSGMSLILRSPLLHDRRTDGWIIQKECRIKSTYKYQDNWNRAEPYASNKTVKLLPEECNDI